MDTANVMLTQDWMNSLPSKDTTLGIVQSCYNNSSACMDTGYVQQLTTYGYYWPPTTVYEKSRPIKLSLAEVEALKKVAKSDDKLKAILSKFTSQIEVIVSF